MSKQQKQTPREESEKITKGDTEPHHIGKHTVQTLTQELFSLNNTKEAFRDKKWHGKYFFIMAEIELLKDDRVKEGIKNKARAMLNGGES